MCKEQKRAIFKASKNSWNRILLSWIVVALFLDLFVTNEIGVVSIVLRNLTWLNMKHFFWPSKGSMAIESRYTRCSALDSDICPEHPCRSLCLWDFTVKKTYLNSIKRPFQNRFLIRVSSSRLGAVFSMKINPTFPGPLNSESRGLFLKENIF